MSTSGGTTVGTTRAQCSCRSSSGLPGVECLGGGPHVLREGPPDRRGHRPLICCGLGLDRLAKIGRYPDHQRALRLRLAFLRLGGWHVANDTKSATRLGGYSRTESPAQRLSTRGTCNQNRIAATKTRCVSALREGSDRNRISLQAKPGSGSPGLEQMMFTPGTVSGHTGGRCPQSGIYRPNCSGKQIALSVGETFPPCTHCRRAVTWTLIQATR